MGEQQIQETVQTETQQQESPAEAQKTETKQQVDNKIPYDRFKEKVDEVNELKRQLAELQKERDEAERKKLEENEQYKELAEQLKAELETIKSNALKAKKEALLAKAGYTDEQVTLLVNSLAGETDEELTESIEKLKTVIPPNHKPYADPSVGNGQKQEPKKTDLRDKGKSLYQRLKEKGKIKTK